MHVRLANGEKMVSQGTVVGLVTCGKWRAHVKFVVLDLAFDVVLGLPWLTKVNPRLNWSDRTLAVHAKGRWVKLPTVASEKVF